MPILMLEMHVPNTYLKYHVVTLSKSCIIEVYIPFVWHECYYFPFFSLKYGLKFSTKRQET